MHKGQKALVILSGGQDSTTCLSWAMQEYGKENVHAVTFNYGQRHAVEIAAARRVAFRAGIAEHDLLDDTPSLLKSGRHEVVNIPDVLIGSSPLVNKAHKVEQYASAAVLPGGLEKTFVPQRNSLFLTVAANRATVLGIEHDCNVDMVTGVSEEDYGGYPDCRSAFIVFMDEALGAAIDSPEMPKLQIVTPLISKDKQATVELAVRLPGAMELLAYSHTCYNGEVPPCGKCHACLLRVKGFQRAGVTDPLLERLASDGATFEGRPGAL